MGSGSEKSPWQTVRSAIIVVIVCFVVWAVFLPPPPMRYLERGKATRAVSDINGIGLCVTKMLSDAGASNFREFFDDTAFSDAVARLRRERAMAPFAASVEIYTDCTYVLLRKGRAAIDPDINEHAAVLRPELVKHLGTSYIQELAHDPWGNLYQVFPGPWPKDLGPIVFRTFLPPSDGGLSPGKKRLETDALLMSGLDIETGEPLTFGVPAPSNQDVYIWSFGANLVSGQPIYDPSHVYAPPAQQHYEVAQEPELCGGGDDINNWDRNQTFMRFYN